MLGRLSISRTPLLDGQLRPVPKVSVLERVDCNPYVLTGQAWSITHSYFSCRLALTVILYLFTSRVSQDYWLSGSCSFRHLQRSNWQRKKGHERKKRTRTTTKTKRKRKRGTKRTKVQIFRVIFLLLSSLCPSLTSQGFTIRVRVLFVLAIHPSWRFHWWWLL